MIAMNPTEVASLPKADRKDISPSGCFMSDAITMNPGLTALTRRADNLWQQHGSSRNGVA
jgi:hypothetical protein